MKYKQVKEFESEKVSSMFTFLIDRYETQIWTVHMDITRKCGMRKAYKSFKLKNWWDYFVSETEALRGKYYYEF
jgi:hypothetical protein